MPRQAGPRRVPPRSGRLRGPTSSPVTIHWDRWGVAHVRGAAARDVFVGLGYAMAQERLWQLDYMRRQARGQLAAIMGPSALGHDRALRTIGIGPAAERDAAHLPHEVAEALDGRPVGTVRAWLHGRSAHVTSFGVLPELQGRGLGRQILTRLVRELAAEGRAPIQIEVETLNRNALGLYRSCGFREVAAYDYHALSLTL